MNTPNKTPTNPPSETPETASTSTLSPTYVLVSGVERNRIFPDMFHIPPESARESLRPCDLVKLWFRFPGDWPDHHMWVIVEDVRPERPGYYYGVLFDCPVTDCIRFGERVEFHCDHVLDIESFSWRCWLRSLLDSVLGLVRWRRIGAYLPH